MTKAQLLTAYLIYLLVISIVTFFLYLIDKRKAKKNKWRIKEVVLLGFPIIGGAFGGFLGMILLRHKTRAEHWYFYVVNILGILLHLFLIGYIAFFANI